jgi:hypothetical protein
MPREKKPDYKYLKNLLNDVKVREELSPNLEWYEVHLQEMAIRKQAQHFQR